MDSVTILLDGSFLWNELSYYGFPGYIERLGIQVLMPTIITPEISLTIIY